MLEKINFACRCKQASEVGSRPDEVSTGGAEIGCTARTTIAHEQRLALASSRPLPSAGNDIDRRRRRIARTCGVGHPPTMTTNVVLVVLDTARALDTPVGPDPEEPNPETMPTLSELEIGRAHV